MYKQKVLLVTVITLSASAFGLSTGVDQIVPAFDPSILNHSFPEVLNDYPYIPIPIQYEDFFRAERALFKYFPRFQPGNVSFDLSGKPYIQYGTFIIQHINDQTGLWEYIDLSSWIDDHIRNQMGHTSYLIDNGGQGNEPMIRFDNDGDAYVLVRIEDAIGGGGSSRFELLLHSTDAMATWSVYLLPYQFTRFEKLDGHNTDCLNRPPVLLMYDTVRGTYITIPEKQGDGTLVIPTPVKVSNDSVPFSSHSGDANCAITYGDKVFIVWGAGYHADGNTSGWPEIPNKEQHPQYNMSYLHGSETVYSRDGMPAFAVTYDITTKTLSAPVFVGWGGHTMDDHNWPEITIDSNGYFHVIINGHHNPFTYAKSTTPYSIADWTDHQLVGAGNSYATLNCDQDDTLYAVTRCSRVGYEFRLALYRKKAGQGWEAEKYLVIPMHAMYNVWGHRVSIDTAGNPNRLFLTYWSQSYFMYLVTDDYPAYINIYPEREKDINFTGPTEYLLRRSERTTLVSDDGGNLWHLAVTSDFQ